MSLPLDEATFSPGVHADDWRAAVRAAGVDLVTASAVGRAYVEELVQQIESAGPYCVVAPGVAVPHAKASGVVRRDALAIVVLDEPVAFGHPHNDPVRVVIGLAATSARQHLRMLAELANALDGSGVTDALAAATTRDEAIAALRT
ncbi:PTS sugar transporter subunit IIA [Agrococcus jenensis]|uniref:Ascorbate-specific PTS system EIIA component n=1 Tax=Agrococcus jenensis TaxID=46353 RepID=A0A3N2APG6_9MICO|nr:PTS sugar transporter subunit IIA [Agrococcus jenensis]ROR64944.1 PTS system ascorbate-specific IIA component [Agrococcus jenensis]